MAWRVEVSVPEAAQRELGFFGSTARAVTTGRPRPLLRQRQGTVGSGSCQISVSSKLAVT